MIVRELVAMLSIDFDRKGLKEAERGLDQFVDKAGRLRHANGRFVGSGKSGGGSLFGMPLPSLGFLGALNTSVKSIMDKMGGLGLGLTGAGIGFGLHKVTDMASDVDEQMNVIQQTFAENTQGVLDWSKTTGEAMGRSEFTLQKYAGSLGALLTPMLGNRKASADMSTTLSGLAVDLASFFNVADDEALVALRAGIVGETEPLRRLGVELTEASLNAWALANGHKAITKSTTQAEKVQLRFAKIMADTVDKQGDAARTSHGFANSSKRLGETLKDTGIAVGQKLLPGFTSLVHLAIELAHSFIDIVKNSHLVEAGLITLGALATVFAIQFALANLPVILFAAGIAAVVLVVEDLMGALRGAKSVTGEFFEGLLGKEEWAAVRATYKTMSEEIGNYVWEMLHPGQTMPRANAPGLGAGIAKEPGLANKLASPKVRTAEQNMMAAEANSTPARFIGNISRMGTQWSEGAAGLLSLVGLADDPRQKARLNAPGGGAGGGGMSIGDVTIIVGAGASPEAVREGEKAANRVQDNRARNLKRSATGW